MTIHKKGTMSRMKNAGTAKNEMATTSTSSDVTTTETVEVVSSTSVVEESNQVKESESRNSMVEVTSARREVIMDSKGNIIKVIETPPQTIQQSSSSRRTGKSSQDFIAGEQMQSIKQAKTTHEIPREHATSLPESRTIQGETTEQASQSVQTQSQSASHSMVQQSSSSSVLIESSSASEDHSGRRSTVVVSHDIKNGAHVPISQTSSRSTESTHVSSETSEAVTKDGQTTSSSTRIRETGERINDNGKTMSTSSREIDSKHTIAPSNVTVIKSTDDIKRSGDKSTRSDLKSERSNIEISTRCNKPGQSTWDGTFVYEKPITPKDKNVVDKTVSSKIHSDTRDNEISVKVTQETSTQEVSFIDQNLSSSSSMTRDSKTIVDEGQRMMTCLRDITSEKIAADTTDFVSEKYSKGPTRYSKPGDSTTDGTYEKESSETMRVVKGATDSTRFISEERRDVSRETSIHVDGMPLSKDEHPALVSGPSQRRLGRPGEFIYEKSQDDVKKHPSDVTVVRTTEKRHDTVDVQDVSEEQNVTESVSTSYIVEYAISGDKKNVEKVTSVSEVILEEDSPENKITRGRGNPERQGKFDTTSRCYKPGQSAWDGTFVYERPVTPDSRRRPEDKRTVKTIDIRDVTEDNSINEADVTSTSYIVEHSSSQQSFSDIRDASVRSTRYETVVYEGRPVETTIRFDGDTSRSKVSTTERRTSPSPRPTSPEKISKDRDLRSTKPGLSTWDGTFVLEKSQDKKRPPSRESIGMLPDKSRPAGSKKTPYVDTSKKYISEATIDLRDVKRDVSSTPEIMVSSVVMEQSRMHESYTDSSNLDFSTTSVDTVTVRDGQPITTQKTVTIQESPHSGAKRLPSSDVITTTDIKETTVKSEKKESRADDRSYRPLKPGSSTWDGSFVYEKPEERKPSDKKSPKDVHEAVQSPIKEQRTDNVDHRTVIILDTSKDIKSATDYSTSSVTVEQTFITDSETYDSSNISKFFIKESAEDKVRETDKKPRQLFDEKPEPSPRQRPKDTKESKKPQSPPQKSPVDRTHRPSKPGASTWDGSFVHEKPQDTQKKPTRDEPTEVPKKPADERKPIEKESKPVDQKGKTLLTPISRKSTETQKDVAEIRHVEDVADITHADITRTSEVLQQSYVIDQSSRFTSVQDVRDVKDERVITEFTTDTYKDVRDVTKSTKEFIDKEQVTNMVARDVIDSRFDTITGPAPWSPTDSTRKPSPERPGYPRGIPGLREDDRPKPTPIAGKPSRPPQRGRSPQRPVDGRPSEIRSKSPEKLRDHTSPTRRPQPAAGKPSRPEEKPVALRKSDKEPEPAKSKPSRLAELEPKKLEQDIPKRGDQSPDSLEEDVVYPKSVLVPDILSKIPLKEQCICELCTCGRHRCLHNLPQEHLEFSYEEPLHTVTSYRQDYDEKHVEKQTKYYHKDHLHTEGEFIGQRRTDYVATRGERAPVRKPQDHLKPEGEFVRRPKEEAPIRGERAPVKKPQDNLKQEGEFVATTTTELVFTGTPGERPIPIRRNTYTKIEGDFIDETTTRSQYIDHRSIQRAEIVKRTDNLTTGEGEFTGTSHTKEDFQTHVIEREPQWRPKYPEDIDRFYNKTDIVDKGPFQGRPKDDFTPKTAERPEVKRPKNNLRPEEGDFEGKPKDDYRPTKGERADVKRPEDNLRPEGPFEGRPKDDYSPKRAERPEVKQGEFERPRQDGYRPAEKSEVKKPMDNLRPEGEFERPRPEKYSPAEKRTPVKHPDNLKPEGEFIGRPKDDYSPKKAERPEIKKPVDNLKPEGDFVRQPKEEAPKKGERADIKKPQDNLRPEGDFERPEKKPIGPAERRSPIKHSDNLKPEVVKGERMDVVKHRDNLKPEGPFEGRPKDDYSPKKAERPEIKKPEDNLKPEGDFVRRPKEEAPKEGERADVRKPKDNLRPEGDFERPEKKPIGPAERRSPIKHSDNLKPEGEFERPKLEEFKPAERPVVKKPHDNLKPEGKFVSRPKEEAPKKGERVDVRKPQDNLQPEGDFERPEKKPIGPAERRSPIKHSDNLKPEEGDFERPEKTPIGPAERRTPIKHFDNLKPEGEFERPKSEEFKPAERPIVKKPHDNLKPEGEFVSRPKEDVPKKGDRADVKKPQDNLRPEGDFERREKKPIGDFVRPQKSPIGPAERRTPIRHEDNLHPEGEFVGRRKDDFIPKRVDRPIQKKPKDNLKPEGEFVGKPKDDYKPTKGERTEIVVHQDNLKMEGDIDVYRSRDDYVTTSKRERVDIVHHEDNLKIEGEFVDIRRRDDYRVTRGERSEVIRREDNLYPEGDFERPEKAPVGPAERRSPIKHPDNLKPEGDFVQRPKETVPIKGDRAIIKKPKDNLKPEGEFERPAKSSVGPGERRSPIKHPDNLHPEGEFVGRPKKDTPPKGDRADVKKPKDNLHPEGEFAKRSPRKVEPAERRTPIKHEDNLHPEGDFYIVPKDDFIPKRGDRSPVKKPQDNLRPEGEMKISPKDDYKYVNGDRVEIRRHEDHLRMEGQIDTHRSRDDYRKITRVEKVDVKRHEDNLRMEGEFIDVRCKDDYVHVVGERVPIKKRTDNLRPEGDFDRPQKIVIRPGEKRTPIKHPDNLKPEGDFERRTPDKIGPGERRSPIRHADNLKPEGDFIGRPRDDFTSKRAERIEVVRREDNLKMMGDFEGTTSHKSTYTIVRGERADIKSHEDNLKLSTGTMETKTTSRDTYAPSKHEPSPAGKTVNRRRHMESSILLGDDTTVMTTTNQRNYNTYTKRTGKDIAAKMSQIESDTRKTVESQTLADSTVVTSVKRTTTSAQSDQRAANAQTVSHHQQTQHISDRRTAQPIDSRRTIEDRSFTEGLNRGQIVRAEDTSRYAIDATHGEHHRQQHQQQQHVERHHQEMTKRDYVNAQHMETRQRSATKQHEQHTISTQARYNSSSPEFRQSINGQTTLERSHVDSATKFGHHRKNVISSSSADISNAVLHRRGAASSTEALHTISSTAADQRKSISNLAESGQYISNSSQSNDRRSLTSLHRNSKEVNPWASSSYERPQRIIRQDNLSVGGKFYSQSEAKSYGNFSQNTQKVERVQRQTNASHINLGDGSTVSSSMYKREYVPRHRGPCPAALLEAKQAPFKHTRDTQKHKFYMPVVSN
ncbi:TXND2 protein, partial [Pseudoatta argentina]